MADLVAPVPGTIQTLLIDEGTLIAEEDEVAVVDADVGPVVVAVSVPGVLREWFVHPGDVVEPGALLAQIDEA